MTSSKKLRSTFNWVSGLPAFAIVGNTITVNRHGDGAGGGDACASDSVDLGTLAAGVLCVAASGSVPGLVQRVLLIAASVMLVGLTFRLDRRAADNLFPRDALSLSAPIGLALWILSLHRMTQTSVTLFLPLLLQVVHQVSPVVINFLSIVISMGWTTGTSPFRGGRGSVSALHWFRGQSSPRPGSPV